MLVCYNTRKLVLSCAELLLNILYISSLQPSFVQTYFASPLHNLLCTEFYVECIFFRVPPRGAAMHRQIVVKTPIFVRISVCDREREIERLDGDKTEVER